MATPYDYTIDTINGPLDGAAYKTYTPPPGGATTASRRPAKPTLEYLTGGRGSGMPADPRTLPTTLDDAVRAMGPRLYQAMNTDPVVRSAKDVLRYGALAGGMDLAPAVKPKAGAKVLTPEERAAKDAVDECWRSVERVADWDAVLLDLLESTWAGVRLAEPTFALAESGPDAGKMALASLRVKPNDAWKFVVSEYMEVVGIQARPEGGAPEVVYPAEKFIWLTNEPRDGDPRGTSDYRPAVEPWCNKVKFWPELYKHLQQFGSASLIGKLGPQHSRSPGVDVLGNPVTGDDVSPETRMGQSLQWFRNGFYIVINHDDDVIPIPPQGDGAAFHGGFALANREITQAILGTPSATLEAEHDSRAKGQTGQDIVALKIESKRKALAAAIRRLLRMLIALNHGPEAADRITPLVTFGQSEPQDRPALWGAAGSLKSSGYLGESQVAELDQMIGLPIRDAEADEQKAKQKADLAMTQQQAMKGPPPGEGGGDGTPPSPGAGAPEPTPTPGPRPKGKGKGKPAEFAYGAPVAPPWHDADLLEAEKTVRALFPSAAAMKRWERGTESDDNLRAVLGMVAADATAAMTAAAEDLVRQLAVVDPAAPAEFASAFEVVSRWRDNAAGLLRRAFLAGSMALMGPREFSTDEWAALQKANEEQVGYLDGFAGAILQGTQSRDATLPARAGLYGAAVWGVAQNVGVQRAVAEGKTRYRSVHVGPDRPCAVCARENAKGWQRIGTLIPIGGRACMANDHCHWEFR